MLSLGSEDVPRPTYVDADTAACAERTNAVNTLVREAMVSVGGGLDILLKNRPISILILD